MSLYEKYFRDYLLKREFYFFVSLFLFTILAAILKFSGVDSNKLGLVGSVSDSDDSLEIRFVNEIDKIIADTSIIGKKNLTENNLPRKLTKKSININKADLKTLDLLPGIGEKTAQDIIAYRKKYGGFKRLDEIMNVPRIGLKKFENIKDYITL